MLLGWRRLANCYLRMGLVFSRWRLGYPSPSRYQTLGTSQLYLINGQIFLCRVHGQPRPQTIHMSFIQPTTNTSNNHCNLRDYSCDFKRSVPVRFQFCTRCRGQNADNFLSNGVSPLLQASIIATLLVYGGFFSTFPNQFIAFTQFLSEEFPQTPWCRETPHHEKPCQRQCQQA